MAQSAMTALQQGGGDNKPTPPSERVETKPEDKAAETAAKKQNQAKNKETMYKVKDLNAIAGERVHDLIDPRTGKVEGFRFIDQYTAIEIPMPIALGLVGNDAFEVSDAKGHVLKPRRTDGNDNNIGVILRAHETIATFDELTHGSLLARATEISEKSGGPKFTKAVSKDELITFLLVNNGGDDTAPVPDEDGVDIEMDED